ncbi:MAG: type IV secretion protein IcmG [Legionella sp. 40-6]|nr:type IVB secretion system protein IcmG/DotF [Legionella sp.]OJY33905.1 MAG: type IV secretion protein IcmG [Legionella sp. 40-6]
MAENDPNDEYRFDELDSYNTESMDNMEYGGGNNLPPPPEPDARARIIRNAMIAIGLVLLAMILYAFFFSGKSSTENTATIPAAPTQSEIASTPPVQQVQPISTPVVNTNVAAPVVEDSGLRQKVDSIQMNQQNVQSQVSVINEQIGNVNTNVNNLAQQIAKLNETLVNLGNQMNQQSQELSTLIERTRPKVVHRPLPPKRYLRPNVYFINAVIPGRAWLIGTNGSTLTVREGTKVPGYGVIKLIDSMEGRILTSSGRVIRFSQEDS